MNKSILLTCLLCLILIGTGFSQNNMRKGFVVLQSGDTLNGTVDLVKNSGKITHCLLNQGGETKKYGVSDTKAFGFTDSFVFQSGLMDGEFIEVLVSGKLALYRTAKNFYVLKEGDQLRLLEERQIRVEGTYRERVRNDNAWKGKLAYLMSDCMKLNPSSVDYNEESIVKAVVKYNRCIDGEYTENKSGVPFSVVKLGAASGFRLTRIEVNRPQGFYENVLSSGYNSLDPYFEVLVNWRFPRLNKNISIGTGLQYYYASFSGRREVPEFQSGVDLFSETSISYSSLTIPLTVNMTREFKESELVFAVGFAYEKFLGNEARYVSDRIVDTEVFRRSGDAFFFNGSVENFVAGLTYYKMYEKIKAGISLNFQRSTELNGDPDVALPANKFSIGLNIMKK